MADFIQPDELFYTEFEPKLQNRFIMYVEGIPAYLIHKTKRPKLTSDTVTLNHMNVQRYVKGKSKWDTVTMELYDPIVPSGAQAVMEWVRLSHESVTGRDGYSDFYKKDVLIKVLGPVGDVVEQWTLKGAWIQAANFNDLDFSSSDPVEISVTLRYDYAILEF